MNPTLVVLPASARFPRLALFHSPQFAHLVLDWKGEVSISCCFGLN